MEHTADYNLTQWAMTDRIQMQDCNADNRKLDAALTEHAAKLAQLSQLGSCQIYTATYTGNGQYGEGNPKINWSGNTVTWSVSTTAAQMNSTNQTYHVVVFYAMD